MIKGQHTVKHAREIFNSARSEVALRTAISRAYFGVFQHLIDHPKLGGFSASEKADDHQRLVDFLTTQRERVLIQTGSRLGNLRRLRNMADYKIWDGLSRSLAEDALTQAEEIVFDWLPADHDI